MSALDQTPENRNFLSPLNFRFQIKKAPHVNFFIQKVNVPQMHLIAPNVPNEFVKVPYPGDHIDYSDLELTFKVDEDLQNYLEIHNWIKSLGKPQSYDQYKEIENVVSWTGDGIYSDISLIALSSTKMANYEIVFTDSHPTTLSGLVFETTDNDVNYMTASATFKYTYYDITKI
jgi:hypothetical protein